MNIHQNARLTPIGRERLARAVLGGATIANAAKMSGVSAKTAKKWVMRFKAEGRTGMVDRSSRPHRLNSPTPKARADEVERLRRERLCGQLIAKQTGLSPATVSRILRQRGINRLKDLDPPEAVRRYERETPGELIHIDIKKLGRFERIGHRMTGDRTGQSKSRGIGWEFVHVAIDDHSRVAFSKIMDDEKKESAVAFLEASVQYYETLGITIGRVMTDNGSCYKSRAFKAACKALHIKHLRTRPYTPKTNGKAERFIQTALREWAYAKAYQTSRHRAEQLPTWLETYNWHRPHGGINAMTPISRLGLERNNLLRLHI